MKKLLLILSIGAFVACNDNAATDSDSKDTTMGNMETDTMTTNMSMDTTNRMNMSGDTSTMSKDTSTLK